MSASSDFLRRIQQQQRYDAAVARQPTNYRPQRNYVDVVDEGNYNPRPNIGVPRTQRERISQERRNISQNRRVLPAIMRSYRVSHPSKFDWTGETTGGGGTTPIAAAQKVYEGIYNNFSKNMQQYQQQVLDQNSVRTAYAADILNKQVDPNNPRVPPKPQSDEGWTYDQSMGLWKNKKGQIDISHQQSLDEQYLGGNLQKYAVDPMVRIGNIIPSSLTRGLEQGYNARDRGENTLGQIYSTFTGMEEGVTGAIKGTPESYKGAGGLYELFKNRSETDVSQMARELEKNHPLVEQGMAIGLGVAGDWYLHPVGRAVSVNTAGVIGGELATPEAMQAFTRKTAERWAADAESQIVTGAAKAPGGYRVYPSEAAMADSFEKSLNDAFEGAQLNVRGGGSRGRVEVLNRDMNASIAGAHGAQSLLDNLTSLYSDRVQRLVDGITGRGPKLTGSAIDSWASLNPDFTEFLDDLSSDLVAKGHLPAGHTTDDLARYLNSDDEKLIREIEQGVVDKHYTPYVQQAADDIAREWKNSYYKTPSIRIGNKVIPVKGLGKAYAALDDKVFGQTTKNFRYNSVFPGTLGLDATRARAWGVRATEEFEKEVRDMGKNYSKAEGEAIQRAIENNTIKTLPPHMQYAANWIKDQYRWMYDDEFTFGARGRRRGAIEHSTPYDPNYAYVSNRGGTIEDRTRFKNDRKATIHDNVRKGNGEGAGRFKTPNAKDQHLRPTENAFEALRQRRIKHNRDMIRTRFRNDMIEKYGIVARVNPSHRGYAAESRGIEKVNFGNLPESMRVNLERTGEDVYLPREMANMVNTFDDITKWHAGTQGRIARSFSTVMGILKRAMTIPWPGFHNKNMIGDVFMGLLDHVFPHDYAMVIKKGMAALAGKDGMFKILRSERGLDLPFRDMWHKYQSEANSGFINSELGDIHTPTKYNLPKRVLGRGEQVIQDMSGFREDSGRFTHYVTAYKEEARNLWGKGERDLAKIDRQASSAALWRVNNYRFDYNALMLWEKKAKTLYFPFYTFIRKAAPTLIQALYQDPRWIAQWTRYLHQHSVGGSEMADSFDGFRVPSDIRDTGYATIGGKKEEPWYVTNDILPTSVFNAVKIPGVNITGDRNPTHEFANSIISQIATPYQGLIEQGTGQQAFLDRPLPKNQSFGEYLFSKLPGTREFQQVTDPSKSLGEKLLQSRAGLGLPIRQLKESQQLYAEQEWKDRLVDEPIKAINYAQDVYHIDPQTAPDGKARIFVVKNNAIRDQYGNATEVASYYTPQDAIAYVKKNLPDSYKKEAKTWDLDRQGNPIQRPVGG